MNVHFVQLIGYSGIVQKGLPKEERQELDRKKEEAMKNKLKHIPFVEEDEETHDPTKMNFNPHYNWYDPLTYQEADEKYGLVFCDRKMVCIITLKHCHSGLCDTEQQNMEKHFYYLIRRRN